MKENKFLEFKSEITNTFLKTVSAFANFNDGEIAFGITDHGDICGVADPVQSCLDIENRINDSISPKPNFTLQIAKDETIHLVVSKGPHTPYLYKGKAYRRSDTATIEVDQKELRQLVLEGSHLYFEELDCHRENLQFHILQEKLSQTLRIENLTDDILRTLGFFTAQGKYNNAAAIFAEKNDFYGIDIARFGKSINEIMDRETVKGESVLKQYDAAVEMYRRYYQYEEISGIERKRVMLIPEDAFREAIANALVHRDWDIGSNVRVAMFSDKIEITSPGGLPSGLTAAEYLNGEISNLRNPILGNVFFRMRYIEMFGTGIRRILQAYEASKKKPQFTVSEKAICVTLPVLTTGYNISADEEALLQILQAGTPLASSELAHKAGYSKAKTLRLLTHLIEENYVKGLGNGRGKKYTIA